MTEQAQTGVDFVCTHTRGHRDEPPDRIPMFTHGRGNARTDMRELAGSHIDNTERREALVDAVSADAGVPSEGETWSEYLGRIAAVDARRAAHLDQLKKSVNTLNHHEIRCPTCRFTERLGSDDMEALAAWAMGNGISSVPLTSARRILQLIGSDPAGA